MTKNSFKIIRNNAPFIQRDDFYHSLLKTSWPFLIFYYLAYFILVNLFFAGLYYIKASSLSLSGISFIQCFFFSVQTFSTVGYGVISPNSTYGNIIVTIETIVGMLSVAVTTGLLFAKFSKPTAKILFSKQLLINNFNNEKVLSFRCANARNNRIISAHMELHLLYFELTSEGQRMTRFIPLKLQKDYTPIFSLSWTVMHTIDSTSPLYNLSVEEMLERQFEFIVLVNGTDDTYSQTIHQTNYYFPENIVHNKYFADIVNKNADGVRTINYKHFNELKDA